MAKKAATKAAKKKAKQSHFPGMEPPRVAAIELAAEEYRGVRDERMELTEQEVKLKEKLRELMIKNELTVYKVPDEEIEVVLVPGDPDVKVRKPKTPKLENGQATKKASRAEV